MARYTTQVSERRGPQGRGCVFCPTGPGRHGRNSERCWREWRKKSLPVFELGFDVCLAIEVENSR